MLIDKSRPHPGQEHGKADKQHERALLPHRYRRPQADQAAAQIDAGQEAMHVVEPRRRLGLAEVHLQRAADSAMAVNRNRQTWTMRWLAGIGVFVGMGG